MCEGRRGTVAFSIPELFRVQHTLRFGWDNALFLGGDAGDDAEDGSVFARRVDEAINSRTWWAWILVIDQVCRAMRKATVWVEPCPCHEGFLEPHRFEELPDLIKKDIAACPMRCRLAQELSAGELMDVVDIAARASAAQLRVGLVPLGLTAAERRELLGEFDLARAHVLFCMTAKTSYLTEEPWCVLQCAHTDRELSHRAIRRAPRGRHPHPIMRKLRGELRPPV